MEASRSESWQSHPAYPEPVLELVHPQDTEGVFNLGDTEAIECENIPFETIQGTAKIARATIRWKHRMPEEITRDRGAMICHGFLAKKGAYEDFADDLASRGIASTTYEAVRTQGLLAGLHPKHAIDPARLVCQAPWGVVREIRERDDIESPKSQFTFIGHSMGGRTAVVNAHKHPESVDSVIMIDAAGLEQHNLLQLLKRIPDFALNEIVPAIDSGDISPSQARRLAMNGLLYISNNPTRTIGEAISIGNADIRSAVKDLSKLDINSAIVVSANDRLLHAGRTAEHASDIADIFMQMPDNDLGHLGPLRHPAKYGDAVVQILEHFAASSVGAKNARELSQAA